MTTIRTTKMENYVLGWEDAYRTGIEDGYERGCAECWDLAYTEGYRAALEELG